MIFREYVLTLKREICENILEMLKNSARNNFFIIYNLKNSLDKYNTLTVLVSTNDKLVLTNFETKMLSLPLYSLHRFKIGYPDWYDYVAHSKLDKTYVNINYNDNVIHLSKEANSLDELQTIIEDIKKTFNSDSKYELVDIRVNGLHNTNETYVVAFYIDYLLIKTN